MKSNSTNNRIKFYITDEVLELLFKFLSQENRINKLKQEINEITEGGSNNHKTQHPKEYFNIINEKIANIETIINQDYKTLQEDNKTALEEFLYQLEDLAEDRTFIPESNTQEDKLFKLKDVITQLHVIKTLALPVLEKCTFHYDKYNPDKKRKINLVQDFNFLQKKPKTYSKETKYGYYNFYPFNQCKNEYEAMNFHYHIMAKSYFTYLKDLADEYPNKFFVCYKPGVNYFGNHTNKIEGIFKEEFDKLEERYKERMLFCINSKPIDGSKSNGFKYNYTKTDLQAKYKKNSFLKNINNKDIVYINGVARDPWAKIGDEGRYKANKESFSTGSTDAMFVKSSNEVEILYGVEIKAGRTKTWNKSLKHLTAQKALVRFTDMQNNNINIDNVKEKYDTAEEFNLDKKDINNNLSNNNTKTLDNANMQKE